MKGYAGSVHSSVRAASAWRFACIVLAIGTVMLAAVAMHAAGVQRTVLVPYGLMSANNAIKVDGKPQSDGQYLAILARSDISSMLDWQPTTISTQLSAFLARLTPAAYARYNLDLRNNATKFSNLNVSEAFYPSTIEYKPPYAVVIDGTLERYTGGTQTLHTQATYTLHYAVSNGIYAISEVDTKQ